MTYDLNGPFSDELHEMSQVLELINYRPRTIDSYLYAISLCCQWLEQTYHISLNDASVFQLREHLIYLHRPVAEHGRGFKPRSVNISNCAIKQYFRIVLRKPLDDKDLPTMRVDTPLPRVPGKSDMALLIMGTRNLKHRVLLALTYACALRTCEVISLRFSDISFSSHLLTIRAEYSKNRCEETVELPENLRPMFTEYYLKYCRGSRPDDWVFPGQKSGTHISKGTPGRILGKRLKELGWLSRGYSYHGLRHAHALHYYLAGADIYQVQIRLRHRSISSTTIYIRMAGKLQERSHIENPFDDVCFRT